VSVPFFFSPSENSGRAASPPSLGTTTGRDLPPPYAADNDYRWDVFVFFFGDGAGVGSLAILGPLLFFGASLPKGPFFLLFPGHILFAGRASYRLMVHAFFFFISFSILATPAQVATVLRTYGNSFFPLT